MIHIILKYLVKINLRIHSLFTLHKLPLATPTVNTGQVRPHPASSDHIPHHMTNHRPQAARDGPHLPRSVPVQGDGEGPQPGTQHRAHPVEEQSGGKRRVRVAGVDHGQGGDGGTEHQQGGICSQECKQETEAACLCPGGKKRSSKTN